MRPSSLPHLVVVLFCSRRQRHLRRQGRTSQCPHSPLGEHFEDEVDAPLKIPPSFFIGLDAPHQGLMLQTSEHSAKQDLPKQVGINPVF